MQDELGLPDKADPRRGWTPAELNSILQNNVVRDMDGLALTTFRCVEWESELYRGVMRARCYPRNTPMHRFHKMNSQVIPCYPWLCTYILGYPGSNVHEVNPWLWQFRRGRPRLGGLSVSETKDRSKAVVRAGDDIPRYPRLCKFKILVLAYPKICWSKKPILG